MYIGFDFMYRKFISGVLIFLIELYFGMENWNIFNGTLNKQLFYNEELKPVYIEHKW